MREGGREKEREKQWVRARQSVGERGRLWVRESESGKGRERGRDFVCGQKRERDSERETARERDSEREREREGRERQRGCLSKRSSESWRL